MKRQLLFCIILSLAILGPVRLTSAQAPSPRLICTNDIWQFEFHPGDGTITHAFILENAGTGDVIIENVKSCCGATTELATKVIPSGSNTTLTAILNLKGRTGSIRKSLYVKSNDPQQRYCQLKIEGNITESVMGTPQESADTSEESPAATSSSKVNIDFYFEEGCSDCEAVKTEVLPTLSVLGDQYQIHYHDIAIKTNYLKLAHAQETLGFQDNANVCMVVGGQYVLSGLEVIRTGLVATVSWCASNPPVTSITPTAPTVPPVGSEDLIASRVRSWTLWVVAGAGLVDGLNPCAISTLVFFMSLLAVAKVKGRQLVIMGLSFCLASFVTYMALGFGLLHAFHSSAEYPHIRRILNSFVVVVLYLMAAISFLDAFRFSQSGASSSVILQLPDRVKTLVHALLKKGVGSGSLLIGGIMTGATVTALESVCTGQVYVPTLVLMIKDSAIDPKALALIFTYNLMFIVPLVAVFALTYFGLNTRVLLQFSKRHVTYGKCLMGVFFLILGSYQQLLLW